MGTKEDRHRSMNIKKMTVALLACASMGAAARPGPDPSAAPAPPPAVAAGAAITAPLRVLQSNPHFFVDGTGKAVYLSGSHTWNSFQDFGVGTVTPIDFNLYVQFLLAHGHNVTILWKKDLPTYFNWGAGGTWTMGPWPWLRPGPGTASDGQPKFDVSMLNQAYFDRLRARTLQLSQNGIYAIVELFDGLGLFNNRGSGDGYAFTTGNNINSLADDGALSSMTMGAPNAITAIQDAYVHKVIDTLNDLPNVIWEQSEEAPDNSTWWQGHMIDLIHTYEAGKPLQHPVLYATLNVSGPNDAGLYNSKAEAAAPAARLSPTSSCGSGVPPCKVNINDSDHSYFGMWNDSAQTNRNYIWQNFTDGASVIFMDPYLVYWSSGNRNLCGAPVNGVCGTPDARWNNFRDNLGYAVAYGNRMNLAAMTPQPGLASTGQALASPVAAGAEYLVYAPSGGTFTVNLSATTHALNVEWLNPSTGGKTVAGTVTGGSSQQSFTPPFGGDAVLYLADTGAKPPAAPNNLKVVP